MKKITLFLLFSILFFTWKSIAQIAPCTNIVNVEVIAPSQSGPHNYFGIKVTLDQSYSEDVVVKGYIHDATDPSNTDHPFEVNVSSGNLQNATSLYFYETSAAEEGAFTTSSITPYLVSDGQSFFRTSNECGSVSNTTVGTSEVLGDSAEVIEDFIYNTIGLDNEELADFIDAIAENGVAGAAVIYSIDSNTIRTILARIPIAAATQINSVKTLLFGSKPLRDLTDGEFTQLAQSFSNGHVAARAAPEELGGLGDPLSCTISFAASVSTAYWRLISTVLLIRNTSILNIEEIESLNYGAVLRYYRQVMAAFATYQGCS